MPSPLPLPLLLKSNLSFIVRFCCTLYLLASLLKSSYATTKKWYIGPKPYRPYYLYQPCILSSVLWTCQSANITCSITYIYIYIYIYIYMCCCITFVIFIYSSMHPVPILDHACLYPCLALCVMLNNQLKIKPRIRLLHSTNTTFTHSSNSTEPCWTVLSTVLASVWTQY